MSIFPTKIVLATEGSEEAGLAARTAAELSKATGSEVHIVYVLPTEAELVGHHFYSEEIRRSLLERAERDASSFLEKQAERIRSEGAKLAETHLRIGRPDKEIVRLAGVLEAGTIVVGSRGLGALGRALMGGVSDSVVRHAHGPVMVVRTAPVVFPTKILLATDGSAEANLAASTAAELVKSTGSELHVVYVEPALPMIEQFAEPGPERTEPESQQLLDEQVERIKEAGGTVAEAHLRLGRPDEQIVRVGEESSAGLIVMGSRGHGGLRRALLGSVSDSVVRHAHCPVLVVRE